MPIMIPDGLPAARILADENVDLIGFGAARRQDIRPLRILLFNLMPTKVATEVQIARLLGHTPLQVELTLLTTASYTPKNTTVEHMQTFYRQLDVIEAEHFDGMIVTGAPVEELDFEDVAYWPELVSILEWADRHVFRRLHICWGAQAELYRSYCVPKRLMKQKLSGIYRQRVLVPDAQPMHGFPARYWVPVSRNTTVRAADIERHADLRVLAGSRVTGPSVVDNRRTRDVYVFDHMEYDTDTLAAEYHRDSAVDRAAPMPKRYFPAGDPDRRPENIWRPYGYLLFSTWLQLLYRDTPYEPAAIPEARAKLGEG